MLRYRKPRCRTIKEDLPCRAFLVNMMERRRWMLTCYSLPVRSLIVSPMNFTWSNLWSGQDMSQVIFLEFNRWCCLVRCIEHRSRWFWHFAYRCRRTVLLCIPIWQSSDNSTARIWLVDKVVFDVGSSKQPDFSPLFSSCSFSIDRLTRGDYS